MEISFSPYIHERRPQIETIEKSRKLATWQGATKNGCWNPNCKREEFEDECSWMDGCWYVVGDWNVAVIGVVRKHTSTHFPHHYGHSKICKEEKLLRNHIILRVTCWK